MNGVQEHPIKFAFAGQLNSIVLAHDLDQYEYLASSDERVRYISGFTGSAATVIISKNKAALFTDGRYEAETIGLDLSELGIEAYPEFSKS